MASKHKNMINIRSQMNENQKNSYPFFAYQNDNVSENVGGWM